MTYPKKRRARSLYLQRCGGPGSQRVIGDAMTKSRSARMREASDARNNAKWMISPFHLSQQRYSSLETRTLSILLKNRMARSKIDCRSERENPCVRIFTPALYACGNTGANNTRPEPAVRGNGSVEVVPSRDFEQSWKFL